MVHYKTQRGLGSKAIDIKSILMRKQIAIAVRSLSGSPRGFKRDTDTSFETPLNRLARMEEAFLKGKKLFPIQVRFIREFQGRKYYRVIAGRHRLAWSIVYNMDEIPIIEV